MNSNWCFLCFWVVRLSIPMWTRYLKNPLMVFLQIWFKCSVGLQDKLIRVLVVKGQRFRSELQHIWKWTSSISLQKDFFPNSHFYLGNNSLILMKENPVYLWNWYLSVWNLVQISGNCCHSSVYGFVLQIQIAFFVFITSISLPPSSHIHWAVVKEKPWWHVLGFQSDLQYQSYLSCGRVPPRANQSSIFDSLFTWDPAVIEPGSVPLRPARALAWWVTLFQGLALTWLPLRR